MAHWCLFDMVEQEGDADMAAETWHLTGDYFENCNCEVVCPCLFSTMPALTAKPTNGSCDVAFAFHIEDGTYGNTPLGGLNVALIAHTPGVMADGNWSVALYLDERVTTAQHEALAAIFSGAAGGVMGSLAPLISTVLGVKTAPITFQKDGLHRSLEIPNVMHMGVRATPSIVPDHAIMASNAHPFNAGGVAMAMGDETSTFSDYGMHWDNSGKNGHYASIAWSNA
jgi:hypothetical protein